jgi:hypothetical protein
MNPSSTSSSLQGYNDKIPKGYKAGQIQQFTPEAMDLYRQLFSHVGPDSYLSKLAQGDEEAFRETEKPALRDFNALQGNLASRFSGMGLGARNSSGFRNTASAQSSNFAQDLQSRRQELSRSALKDLFDMSHTLLNEKPYERNLIKKDHKTPFWKKALGFVSPLGGDIAEGGTENTENFLKALQAFA